MRTFSTGNEEGEYDHNYDALSNQLSHFVEVDQYERVIGVASEMLAIEPDSSWVHNQIGWAYSHQEKYELAEKHLKKSIAIEPENVNALVNIGWMELQRKRTGVSDEYIRNALQLDPTNCYAWYLLGLLCVHYDDYKQAIICVEQMRGLEPENDLADLLHVQMHSDIKGEEQYDREEKREEFERLLKYDPEDSYIHYHLGLIALNDFVEYDEAESYFRKALQYSPQDKDYQDALIQVWRKRDPVLLALWVPFIPIVCGFKLCQWCNKKKWPYLLMILLSKYLVVLCLIVTFVFFICFWPITKIYEYMTMVEVHRKLGVFKFYAGGHAKLYTLSYRYRLALLVCFTLLYWGIIAILVPSLFVDPIVSVGLVQVLGGIFGVFIILTWGWLLYKFLRKGKRNLWNKKFNQSV